MRQLVWNTLAIAVGLGSVNSVPAADIMRHTNGPGPHNILESVTIPANADVLALSGVVPQPIDPAKRATLEDFGDTKTQTISVLNQIKANLERRGYKMSDVVRMTVYLTADPKNKDGRMDFQGMNAAYRMFFGTAENPNVVARSTVQVSALANPLYLVEIEVTAAKAPK